MIHSRSRAHGSSHIYPIALGLPVALKLRACGHEGPAPEFARRVVPDSGPDVASRNPPPDQELDAQLTGKAALGQAARAAVRPSDWERKGL